MALNSVLTLSAIFAVTFTLYSALSLMRLTPGVISRVERVMMKGAGTQASAVSDHGSMENNGQSSSKSVEMMGLDKLLVSETGSQSGKRWSRVSLLMLCDTGRYYRY